ncbi:MAG: LptA/OstA family protein [Alphaproteobacteria bacterium]
MTSRRLPLTVVCLAALFLLTVNQAGAQSIATGSSDDGPIEIEADDGIEWLRDSKRYIARGNATASQGGLTVRSDTLTAFYRGGENGERQQIFRMDADRNVVITAEDAEATGDKAVYHVDKQVAVLVGENLQLVTRDASITAEESLEFWQARSLAVARGEATIIQNGNRLVAGVLTAYIQNGADGKRAVQRIDALDGVHISTETEIVRGREGVYDVPKEIATVCGDVKITRGENQLNGNCAVVDMKTGRSKITGGGSKVKGLILSTE